MQELSNQNILVLGLGISGRSAANFCAAHGARVVAADERAAEQLDNLDALDARIEYALGQPFPEAGGFDLVIPSPGVPPERYQEHARRVWGDIELASRALQTSIIAVTGTNGKTTTALLLEAMLCAAGARARAAGNLGKPALDLVGEPLDFAVLEVSSFQLEATESFSPDVAVLLNITPDHLDRHQSFDAYADAKLRILANQHSAQVAVLNLDDPAIAARATTVRGRVVPFRTKGPLAKGPFERGAYLDANAVMLCGEGSPPRRIPLDGIRLTGAHNLENVTAALAAVDAAGVDPLRATAALASFTNLPHRSEFVREVGGARFFNDSKATNPGAALRCLAGFSQPLVWIAGGRDKGFDFGELADAATARVRCAILIGESASKLKDALNGRIDVHAAASIEDAVHCAARLAQPGDVVLLSPACASHDQFRDFEERGDRFRAAVAELGERGGTR